MAVAMGLNYLTLAKVYPLMRGGTSPTIVIFASPSGLSPRVRGNYKSPAYLTGPGTTKLGRTARLPGYTAIWSLTLNDI